MDRIFDEYGAKSNSEHDTIKAAASEVLSLYGALRHWVEVRMPKDARVTRNVEAFLAACKVVDIVLLAKRGEASRPRAGAALVKAVAEHMRLHCLAYGDTCVKPKHHWAFDVAEQLGQRDYVFDSFIVERLHLRVKTVAERVRNTVAFESSVLSGVVNEHVRRGQSCDAGGGLIGKFAPHPSLANVLVADRMELGGVRVSIDDFVFRGDVAGLVVACCLLDGELWLIVDAFLKVKDLSQHSSTWRPGGARETWPAIEVSECLSWLQIDGGQTLIIQM